MDDIAKEFDLYATLESWFYIRADAITHMLTLIDAEGAGFQSPGVGVVDTISPSSKPWLSHIGNPRLRPDAEKGR